MPTLVPLESAPAVKVLEIVGNAIVGGMETYVRRLVPALVQHRCEVSCLCPFESAFTDALREAGCDVHVAPMHGALGWETIQFAQTLVRTLGIDVMHAHLPNAYALATLVGAITGVRTLATIHGRVITMMDLEAYRLGNSELSVVCQHSYLQALNLGVAPAHVQLIPNGLDVEAFDATRGDFCLHRHLGLAAGTELVGFVGRLAPEKNPAMFVRMAAIVHAERPDLHFVLVGDGPLTAPLHQLARQLGVAANVHFAGVQSDMRSIYDALQLVVLTSDSEGMPLALIEAMACARAILATQVGGVPELVRADLTGILVPPGDADRAAAQTLALMRNPQQRALLGGAARDSIRARYSHAAVAERIAQRLASLARHRPGQDAVPERSALRSNRRSLTSSPPDS